MKNKRFEEKKELISLHKTYEKKVKKYLRKRNVSVMFWIVYVMVGLTYALFNLMELTIHHLWIILPFIIINILMIYYDHKLAFMQNKRRETYIKIIL